MRIEPRAVQTCHQLHQCALGPAGVEVRDAEGDLFLNGMDQARIPAESWSRSKPDAGKQEVRCLLWPNFARTRASEKLCLHTGEMRLDVVQYFSLMASSAV